jgi:catalase (peroxidase I)
MLTADLALAQDEFYRPISQKYATDLALLEKDFGAAWYRLASSDMGPATRCIGEFVRPPQHWQHTLPEASTANVVDYVAVRSKIQELLDADDSNYNAFVNLAYQCYSTFRMTDYRGGCNGARIRFSPEAEWHIFKEAEALATLQPVKDAFPDASFSDIIVLAGQTAIEGAGGNPQPFCGGRTDATDGAGSVGLKPRVYDSPLVSVIDDIQVKGLTPDEAIALMARPTGPSFSNQFFKDMLPYAESFNNTNNGTSVSAALTSFTDHELALLKDKEFLAIIYRYAEFEEVFQEAFAEAWNKIMTVDRYDGPFGNACKGVNTCTTTPCFNAGEQSQTDVKSSSSGAADVSLNMAMIATIVVASVVASNNWFSM